MKKECLNKVGELASDNLIAGLYPPAEVTGVLLRGLETETVLERGTVLARSSVDSKLVALGTKAADGETLTPAYILCDDTVVGTEDTGTAAYRSGNFNSKAVKTADGSLLSESDKDTLRKYRIVFQDNMQ